MKDPICLDTRFSTTRLLTRERPVLKDGKDWRSYLFLPEGRGRKGEGGLRAQGYFKKGYRDKPCVTVVTVVFNGERHLEETIKSVLEQDYDNLEYIVIDGGSTDGTLDIIKRYEYAIDYWVSEEDRGISDAMNKGIATSSGEIIAHLHSDDFYEPYAISRAVGYFLENPGCRWLIGEVNYIDPEGRKRRRLLFPPEYSYGRLKRANFIPHQGAFLKREIFEEVGLFNVEIRYAMDYEMWLRIGAIYEPLQVKDVFANFRETGLSSTEPASALREEYVIRNGIDNGTSFRIWNRINYFWRRALIPYLRIKRRLQYTIGI